VVPFSFKSSSAGAVPASPSWFSGEEAASHQIYGQIEGESPFFIGESQGIVETSSMTWLSGQISPYFTNIDFPEIAGSLSHFGP